MTTLMLNVARPINGEATMARPPKVVKEQSDVSKSEFESRATQPLTIDTPESQDIEQDGSPSRLTAEGITQDLLQSLFSVDQRSPDQKIDVLVEQFRQSVGLSDILVTPATLAAQNQGANSTSGQKLLELVKTSDLKTIQEWLSGADHPDIAHLKQAVQRIFDARTSMRGPGPSFALARPIINPYPGDEGPTLANSLPYIPANDTAPRSMPDATGQRPVQFKLSADVLASGLDISADIFKNLAADIVSTSQYPRPIVTIPEGVAADVAPTTTKVSPDILVRPNLASDNAPTLGASADLAVDDSGDPTGARPVPPAGNLARPLLISPENQVKSAPPIKMGKKEGSPLDGAKQVAADLDLTATKADILNTVATNLAQTIVAGTSKDGDWTEILPEESAALEVSDVSNQPTTNGLEAGERITPKLDRPLTEAEVKHTISRVNEAMSQLFADKKQSQITIHLRPEELGEVMITVQRQGRQLIAEVSASQEVVRESLLKHRNDLVTTIERQGFSLSELNVRHEPNMQWNHGQQSSPQDQMGWKDEFDRARNIANANSDRTLIAPKDKTYTANQGGLDLAI